MVFCSRTGARDRRNLLVGYLLNIIAVTVLDSGVNLRCSVKQEAGCTSLQYAQCTRDLFVEVQKYTLRHFSINCSQVLSTNYGKRTAAACQNKRKRKGSYGYGVRLVGC